MTAHRLLTPRWLATGGAVLLAGVLGVALLLRDGGPACAAPPPTSTQKGKATFYDLAGGVGNCNFAPPADDLYVALGRAQYSGATACGSYIDVTGPKGKVRVKVFDSCPECAVGHLDLSRTAFKRIANESAGVVPITYRAVPNAPTPGPLSITFAEGSSQYWWAILIDNHANPIVSVQAKGPGRGWMTAAHASYNFWIIDKNTGKGPFSIRITDSYGHVATATGVKLLPQRRQTTSVRLSGKAGSAPAVAKGAGAPSKKAKPAPSKSKVSSAPAAPSSSAAPAVSESPAASPDREADGLAQAPPVALAAAPAAPSCGG
ncbi:expansin EXLX1 family cellulose-binding protein [Krasilnikovia sp. MM14-A1004]|uniref:expansin EXLX1 family cellulose-binding protein n=1 Tax=Krasilnikovia sp. MM14-A1004 TaxID=3373541 RepID=UPI00399C5AED